MVRSLAIILAIAVSAAADTRELAMAQPPSSPPPSYDVAQPAGYYSPQYSMAQPFGYYQSPQYTMAQRPAYHTVANGYAPPSPVPIPRSVATPTTASPTFANSAGTQATASNIAPSPMGTPFTESEPCGCQGGRHHCGLHGWGGYGEDMPQHHAYYPPMHGYYYFRPYHYTHVPTQQGFATQFGVDPRNPYSNDFFKVVYAEYRASLLRTPPENMGAPPGAMQQGPLETPADTIKKLKALKDDGVLSPEEFESKKSELLGRM